MASSADTTDDAPRCLTCGYILLGLAADRCPECGSTFDPDDAASRSSLLPWERPEAGGRVARLVKTLLQASFHPGHFFTRLERRRHKRITNAPMLIAGCVLVSLCFYAMEFLLTNAAWLIRGLIKHGQLWQALNTVLTSVGVTWSVSLVLPIVSFLHALLSVAVIALLLFGLFRGRLGSLRCIDLAAVYSPAVAFGAFIQATIRIVAVAVFSPERLVIFYYFHMAVFWAQTIVLLLLFGFSCRRLLHLSRWKTVGMLIIGGVLEHVCGYAVFLLWSLPIFNSW